MLGDSSSQQPTSGGSVAAMAIDGGDGGANDSSGDQGEKSCRPNYNRVEDGGDVANDKLNYGENRWPRQETLALLKIRSDMDEVFRDSSHKGPLWEEVSRKLNELGYQRSAKKCKEKFENVFKYHKRTKEGRTSKSEGKTYKFFDQLQALETNPSHSILQPPIKPQNTISTNCNTLSFSANYNISPPMNFVSPNNNITPNPTIFPTTTTTITQVPSQPMNTTPKTYQTVTKNLFSSSTSSSTASDEELGGGGGGGGGKRKRKWEAFFAKLTKDMIRKQEELQAKFLETLKRHESERTAREESWRVQEMTRINREHEVLLQERSASTTKDNALIAFLQEVSVQGQHNYQPPPMLSQPQHPPPPQQQQHLPPLQQPIQPTPPPQPPPGPVISTATALTNMDIVQRSENNNNGGRFTNVVELTSSSRWPKAEVQALISMKTSLDQKYQENGVKGTLWEEVSMGMQRLGYNRNAKKCKEKWENINKYFKKVKDSYKKRSEESKTCPYFHQLDALYKEKNKNETSYNSHVNHIGSSMEPLMVRPEQQWPPPEQEKNVNQSIEGEEEEEMDDEDEDGETEEGADDGGFEVVVNKPS